MNWDEHGGGCCGMTHVYGFDNRPNEKLLNKLDKILANYTGRYSDSADGCDCEFCVKERERMKTFNALLEAVLVDEQMFTWAPELRKRGFRLVNRFFNSNSGNYCNVLHFTPHEPRGKNRKAPSYKW